MSEKVLAKANVGFYPKEKPGMGQALKGQLILTDRRLIYVRYSGGKYITAKTTDYSDRIDEGLRKEGSFEVSLNKITEAKADRVWGTPYFRLRYQAPSGEKACSLVFVSAMNTIAVGGLLGLAFAKSPYDHLAKAIEKLKASHTDEQTTENSPKYCPKCGHQLTFKGTFCTNCGVKY
jgi:hypothetical protein